VKKNKMMNPLLKRCACLRGNFHPQSPTANHFKEMGGGHDSAKLKDESSYVSVLESSGQYLEDFFADVTTPSSDSNFRTQFSRLSNVNRLNGV
jgi:hypothetical protein